MLIKQLKGKNTAAVIIGQIPVNDRKEVQSLFGTNFEKAYNKFIEQYGELELTEVQSLFESKYNVPHDYAEKMQTALITFLEKKNATIDKTSDDYSIYMNSSYPNEIISKDISFINMTTNNILRPLIDHIDFDPFLHEMVCLFKKNQKLAALSGKKYTQSDKFEDYQSYLCKFLSDKLIIFAEDLYLIGDNKWVKFGRVSSDYFSAFMIGIGRTATELSTTHFQRLSKNLFAWLTVLPNDNKVIQFADSYLLNNQLIEGLYTDSYPFAIIDKDCLDIWNNEVNDYDGTYIEQFFDHITRNDKAAKHILYRDIALALITDSEKISAIGKTIIMYGSQGGEGKSTLATVLKKTLEKSNVRAFEIDDLSGNAMNNALSGLLAIDADATNDFVNGKAASNFKKIVTADDVQSKALYKDIETVNATSTLMLFTNNLPKISDKSNGFARRIDLFELPRKLLDHLTDIGEEPKDWFSKLYSDESINYLFAKLVIMAKDIIENTDKYQVQEDAESLLETKQKFQENNNHLYEYFEELDFDLDLIGFKKTDVYNNYYEWAIENHEKPFGKQQFYTHITSVLHLHIGRVYANAMHPLSSDYTLYSTSGKNNQIRGVIMEDK